MARVWKWSVVIFLLTGLLLHREEAMMNALMDTPYQVFDSHFISLSMGWFFKYY